MQRAEFGLGVSPQKLAPPFGLFSWRKSFCLQVPAPSPLILLFPSVVHSAGHQPQPRAKEAQIGLSQCPVHRVRGGQNRGKGLLVLSVRSDGTPTTRWGRGTTTRWSFRIWGMEPCKAGICCWGVGQRRQNSFPLSAQAGSGGKSKPSWAGLVLLLAL